MWQTLASDQMFNRRRPSLPLTLTTKPFVPFEGSTMAAFAEYEGSAESDEAAAENLVDSFAAALGNLYVHRVLPSVLKAITEVDDTARTASWTIVREGESARRQLARARRSQQLLASHPTDQRE